MQGKKLILLAAALFAATLFGCGSNRDSGGDQTADPGGSLGTDPVTGLAFVGADTCIGCHEGFSWSDEEVAAFLAGKHVNNHAGTHTYEEMVADGCAECHDPIGDSPGLSALVGSNVITVGCENCHGAGGQHFGVGPIPNASPDFTVCGKCHGTLPENHLTYHPEADNIIAKYEASAHAASGDRNSPRCVKCHTDEGGQTYKAIETIESLSVALPLENASPIQCRTCHDPHNAGELLEAASVNRSGVTTASAEYNTCANCHQEHDAELGADPTPGTTSDGGSGDLIYHAKRWDRVIAATHYDDPATGFQDDSDGNGTNDSNVLIEGYAINPANERACRDCHDVHASDATINRQWARSAHGGHILTVKEEAAEAAAEDTLDQLLAVQAAGVTDATGIAWTHYDWDAGNRRACQRCHTATGAKNYMNNPANYDPANNDYSHLVGWANNGGTITSSSQNEMLYCWGCHANNSGALRTPGAITQEYDPLVVVTYPDVGASNVCMACHVGLETGEVIKIDADPDGIRGFINSHYLAAGGTVFTTTGYEYAGRNYNNVTFYAHDQIGTAAEPGTGDGGPCVGCHMSTSEPHLFLPVTKDHTTGQITAVTSTACNICHPGLSAGEVDDWKVRYEAALAALEVALASKGIHFANSWPYFFTAPYVDGGTNNAFTNWAGVYGLALWKETMGAAFNYNLLEHDSGAYAHNKFYTKGLIWDSIDFIYDGVLDNDVPEAITALTLDAATRTAAREYLGNTRPGDGSRPALQ